MYSARAAARSLFAGARPAAWALAAAGLATIFFPSGIGPPGRSGPLVWEWVPDGDAVVSVSSPPGHISGLPAKVHPVVLLLKVSRRSGSGEEPPPDRHIGGGWWGVEVLSVGRSVPPGWETEVQGGAQPLAAGCRGVPSRLGLAEGPRGGGGRDPVGADPATGPAVGLDLGGGGGAAGGVGPVSRAYDLAVLQTTADPVDGVPALTFFRGDGMSNSAREPRLRIAGRWTGTRAGRLTDPSGREYAFLSLRLPLLLVAPLLADAVVLWRAWRRRRATMAA